MRGVALDIDRGDGDLQEFDPEQAGLLLGDHQTGPGATHCCSTLENNSDFLEPTPLVGEGRGEAGSSACPYERKDEMICFEWGSEEAYGGLGDMATVMEGDILGSLDFQDDKMEIRDTDDVAHFAHYRDAGSSETSSGSSPRSEEGGGTQMECVSKEDKKRRNRVAARVCRFVFQCTVRLCASSCPSQHDDTQRLRAYRIEMAKRGSTEMSDLLLGLSRKPTD